MILFKFNEEKEDRGESMPCLAFRWTFQVGKWWMGFVHQHQHKSDLKWNDNHSALYEISLVKSFRFHTQHIYYDGPHCMLQLGWLRFDYGGNPFTGWCYRCMPKQDWDK